MAANAQGKFWQMHDKLFGNQQALDRPALEKYAQEIGLNVSKFKIAMDNHSYKKQIEADSQAGNAVGANGTPAFFVNGQSLSGAQPFDAFKAVIDKEITHADELLKKGIKRDKLYEEILRTLPEHAANTPKAPAAEAAPERVEIAAGDAPLRGPKKAPVLIVEYSDFQ